MDSKRGRELPVVNPATERIIAHVAAASAEDVHLAVVAARSAFDDASYVVPICCFYNLSIL